MFPSLFGNLEDDHNNYQDSHNYYAEYSTHYQEEIVIKCVPGTVGVASTQSTSLPDGITILKIHIKDPLSIEEQRLMSVIVLYDRL